MPNELVTTGFEDFNRVLAELKHGAPAAARFAGRAAMRPLQAEAKRLAPRESGALAESIKIRAGKRSAARITIRVTTGTKTIKTEKFYSSFQNWGWRPGDFPENVDSDPVPAINFMEDAAAIAQPQMEPILVREVGVWLRSKAR